MECRSDVQTRRCENGDKCKDKILTQLPFVNKSEGAGWCYSCPWSGMLGPLPSRLRALSVDRLRGVVLLALRARLVLDDPPGVPIGLVGVDVEDVAFPCRDESAAVPATA